MNPDTAQQQIDQLWDDSIVPELIEYIRIPAKSPHFDADWAEHGYLDDAVKHIARWCENQNISGMQMEVVRLKGRTPLIFMELPAANGGPEDDTVLLYGHLDKQPEMTGWDEDLGPWKPVMRDGKLYGRGGADDGYAAYASLAAIQAVREQKLPHARAVVIIEACEESGSYDLPHYIDHLSDRIGTPSLVVCLDSGAGNYEQLWLTTSLRGMAAGTLKAEVISEGVHSGYASGIVPSSFRVLRQILSRLEDGETGRILPDWLHVDIPAQRRSQTEKVAELLEDEVFTAYPFLDGVKPMADNNVERLLNRNWRPALEVTGADGLPAIEDAGNVLRPQTSLKLSLRLPPTLEAGEASARLKTFLQDNPPAGAQVEFSVDQSATGWNAPDTADWLEKSVEAASQTVFGRSGMYMGEGGTIPFMGMLGDAFPEAQFMITGVLGPKSNAHGPNEFLHVPFGKKLTTCVAQVLVDHAVRED